MSSRKGQGQLWQIADGAATESSSNRERVVRNSNWQEFGIYNRGFRDYRSEIKLEATWYPLLRQGIPFSDMVSPSQTWYPLLRHGIPFPDRVSPPHSVSTLVSPSQAGYPLVMVIFSWDRDTQVLEGIPYSWRDTQGYLVFVSYSGCSTFTCKIVGVTCKIRV